MVGRIDEVWVELDLVSNYAVSNYGRVLNVTNGRELKATPDKDGYYRVWLYYNGVRYRVYLHLLVAKVFFVNYKPGIPVRHINGLKNDNSVLNLTLSSS